MKQEQKDVTSLQMYRDNTRLKRAVERSLQVSVEVCLDIGRRIIAQSGYEYPNSNREVFEILIRKGIIPASLQPALQKMAGFRNIVVHEYVRIDDAQVYGMLKANLEDFETFATAIVNFLSVAGEEEDS
ncbi:MAG: DUF86 domain-containing protein [Chloroflexi bacterium]|nr:DUF86 domain-containing protein [Chloroflexota bacterium]